MEHQFSETLKNQIDRNQAPICIRRKFRGKWMELQLVKQLESLGFIAERTAMSGQGRRWPDVFAIKPQEGIVLLIECKSSRAVKRKGENVGKRFVKIGAPQISKLVRAKEMFSLPCARIFMLAYVGFPQQGIPRKEVWRILKEGDAQKNILIYETTPSDFDPGDLA